MKRKVHLMLAGLFVWTTVMTAQEIPEGLVKAFKWGNAEELASYLGDKAEIIILNKSQVCNKEQAKKALAGFFAGNKVNSFVVNHQGKRDESSFIIATCLTSGGAYRINCFFKKNGNQYLINQIRIDKTDE